jgi:hypothetical protein
MLRGPPPQARQGQAATGLGTGSALKILSLWSNRISESEVLQDYCVFWLSCKEVMGLCKGLYTDAWQGHNAG